MSSLAKQLANVPPPTDRARRGPANACGPIYGPGDMEDWEAVEALRTDRTWREVQAIVDEQVGVTKALPVDKFRYHWRRRCFCWSDEDRA